MIFGVLISRKNISNITLVLLLVTQQFVVPAKLLATPQPVSSGVVIAQLQTGAQNAATQDCVCG